jgi:hypothetical protein
MLNSHHLEKAGGYIGFGAFFSFIVDNYLGD